MSAAATYIDKDTIHSLSKRSNLWGLWLTFHVWASIILAGALFVLWPHPLIFILSVLLIGSRQHAMSVLMHEAAHNALFKSQKLNDFVGHYVVGVPVGVGLAEYRRYHLKHHRHAQRPEDPDLHLSEKFPVSRASLIRKFARDISGWTAIRLRLAQIKLSDTSVDIPSIRPLLIANAVIFVGLALLGFWWAYFALWLLPFLTWYQVVLRLRNIAEHALTTNDDNPLTHARTTRTHWLSRIFIAPYWVNYHAEHHAYMYVPCYRLKAIHKELLIRGYRKKMEIKPGYRTVLAMASNQS